jgi:hypothetical protein
VTEPKELSKYNLNSVGVQEVRWHGGDTKPAGKCTFSMERGMRIVNWVQERIISAVKKVEFVSDRMLYIILRGH